MSASAMALHRETQSCFTVNFIFEVLVLYETFPNSVKKACNALVTPNKIGTEQSPV